MGRIQVPSELAGQISQTQWRAASAAEKNSLLHTASEIFRERRKVKEFPLDVGKHKLAMAGGRMQQAQFAMSAIDWAKPFVIGAIVLFLFIGGGAGVILNVMGAMTWYYWVGAIFLLVMIWRLR